MSELRINALAFDRQNANRRPAFAMRQDLTVGDAIIAREVVEWNSGLAEVRTEAHSLNESSRALCTVKDSPAKVDTWLQSRQTMDQWRERSLSLSHEPVTLSSLPLLVAKHWNALMAGKMIFASYLVLKVQRAATVRIRRIAEVSRSEDILIEVLPTNLLLRLIFGATRLHFVSGIPRLSKIDGLLDPRDRKPNGLWREYLGTIEFTKSWDLSELIPSSGVQR